MGRNSRLALSAISAVAVAIAVYLVFEWFLGGSPSSLFGLIVITVVIGAALSLSRRS
jgi:hypothetical protein